MISVTEARKLLQPFCQKGLPIDLDIENALGFYLAETLTAPADIPPFNNSAMDGYAFRMEDYLPEKGLEIKGEAAAGIAQAQQIETGTALRIFTGAPVPENADVVVMQEKTQLQNHRLFLTDETLSPKQNIRFRGSQNKKGDTVALPHTLITPNLIGYLTSLGIGRVKVFAKPRVAIVVTGNEIVAPGQPLRYGQVYDCNSYALQACLQQYGVTPRVYHCQDDPQQLEQVIAEALLQNNLLLLTGGVSVGEYDFVTSALLKNGVVQLFHRIKQKPAKPLFAGYTPNCFVFGLPGNPASVLTSFYVYVKPLINAIVGNTNDTELSAEIQSDFSRKPGLTQFLKARCESDKVTLLDGQESYRMDGFAMANCLVEVPEETESLKKGDFVKIIPC